MLIYDEVYQSPNFGYPKGSFGRGGRKIEGICLHITGASWQSNYNWIMNSAANASYNALVKEEGTVVSLVPEQNAAYSHGHINKPTWPLLKEKVNPNLYTLSLARTGSNQNTWTPAQLASTLKVLRHWSEKYNIPLKRPYIFGHFEIDSVSRWYCPGKPFFERVISELEAEAHLNDQGTTEATGPVVWHRVIAGSYKNPDNAIRQVQFLRANGIDAFIDRYEINQAGGKT
jgi:N-acetyl-anhydromuramyl-L-alanine amidase AmpD